MNKEDSLDNRTFEEIVNEEFEEAETVYEQDMHHYHNTRGNKFAPEFCERQALRAEGLVRGIMQAERNDSAIKMLVSSNALDEEALQKIMLRFQNRKRLHMDKFPTFSRKLPFIGRQFYLGGDYYEEAVILPENLVARSFIKKFGDENDMKNSIEIAERISLLPATHHIPILNIDKENNTITYLHSGRNVLETIKEQDEAQAFETVREGLKAQIQFAEHLTKNRNIFRRIPEEAVLKGFDFYIFEKMPGLEKTALEAVSSIAPGIDKKQKKEIASVFRTGSESKLVMPSDPRSVNTVFDNKCKVCDVDGLVSDSIHHLLYGYLERIGKVQRRELEFVDYAYRLLNENENSLLSRSSENDLDNFRARYLLQKPVENLNITRMLMNKIGNPLLNESEENKKTLENMALIHYNRALRGMRKMNMCCEATIIRQNTEKEFLTELDNLDYFALEKEMELGSHDYKSMLTRELIDEDKRKFSFKPEEKPLLARTWEKARLPVGVAISGTLLFTMVGLIAPHLPESSPKRVNHQISNHLAYMLESDLDISELDYCTLWGDFDRSHKEQIMNSVKENLHMYLANRSSEDKMAIDEQLYNRMFGYDITTASKKIIGGYYVDNLADRWAMTWGLDPEMLRAVSHASITDKELAQKAKEEGYFGSFVLVPMETITEVSKNREHYRDEMSTREYWQEDYRDYEIASIASQALASHRGPVSVTYSKLFAGSEAVERAMQKAGSDDFIDYSPHLPETARELTERALSFHIPVMLAPTAIEPRSFRNPGEYSYEPIIREFLKQDMDLKKTMKIITSDDSE